MRAYHGSKRGLEGAIRADRGNPAAACARVTIVDTRPLSAAECEGLWTKAANRRDRAVRETERIRAQYRREGRYFDEILDRMAKEGAECP